MARPVSPILAYHDDPQAPDPARLGGKATNLALLGRASLPVPPWFCVTTVLFDRVAGRLAPEVERTAASLSAQAEPAVLAAAGAALRGRVLAATIADADADAILAAYDVLFPDGAPVSVRSSVVGEDSAADSFAGQMDTFLQVARGDLVARVQACWASAFSDRALAYRLRKGLPLAGTRVAVVVQRMVAAVAAGVLFTQDPRRAGEVLIAAAYGLGEGVVADRVESDTYHIARGDGTIRREVAAKTHRVEPAAAGGTVTVEVPADRRIVPVLDDARIRALVAAGSGVERLFGRPQDVEWAFDAAGTLFLLQSRPITAARRARLSLWDNSNIVESYPGLSTPLTYSFVRNVYEQVFRATLIGFGADPAFLRDHSACLTHMVGYLRGRIYYNLVNWYNVVSALQGAEKNRQAMEMMMGVRHSIAEEEELVASLRPAGGGALARLRLGLSTAALFAGTGRLVRRLFRDLDAFLGELASFDFAAAGAHELMELYHRLETRFLARWALTNYNDFFAMKFYALLRDLVKGWRVSEAPNLHNDLLCGETGMESVEPVKSLLEIARAIRGDPAAAALFAGDDPARTWAQVCATPAHASLRARIERHLERFGDRALFELKLETPHLRDNLPFLISLVADHVRAGRSVEEMEQAEGRIRRAAEAEVARGLAGRPLRRWAFRWVLARARRHVKWRENLRLARARIFGVVKRIFRALGDRLAAAGALDDPGDVFFLEYTEAFDFVRGTSTLPDLRTLVRLRREQFRAWEAEPPRGRFVTRGPVYADAALAGTTPGVAAAGPQAGPAPATAAGAVLQGVGCSAGRVRARARIVRDPYAERRIDGEILVTPMTDPGWVFLMVSAGGIVVEKGSLLSHTAIIGRELGIPTVVGVEDATRRIAPGQEIEIDGEKGTVVLR